MEQVQVSGTGCMMFSALTRRAEWIILCVVVCYILFYSRSAGHRNPHFASQPRWVCICKALPVSSGHLINSWLVTGPSRDLQEAPAPAPAISSPACVSSAAAVTQTAPPPTTPSSPRVSLAASPKRNDLVSPQSVSQEQLSVLTSLYRGNIFMVTSRWSVSAGTWAGMSKDFYREGQPILAYFPDSRTLGVLVQPTDLAGGQCTDRNPAGYLRSGSTSCTREVENLVWSCTILPSLRADTYYQGFVLLPVQIRPMNGHVAPSPKVEGESCVNVVSEPLLPAAQVTYLIQCQGHAGIIDARVAFSFSTVPLGVRRLRQVFHLQFLMGSGNFDAQRRSGNPGYLVGMPVLAFRENSPVSLTVPVNTAGGSCSPSARSPVVFGHGLQAGCHHRPDPQHTCRKLQDTITLLLLGPHPPDSLGMLGNASEHHLGDVTRVINDVPKLPDIPCKTICELATSMELQILWANLGPLSNPQSVILGARYRYRTQEVQCSRKTVSLSASVTFVDTSLHPPAPRSSWKFPLYPSPLSHASGQAGVHIPARAALFICCCCLLSALA
ncbi:tectonic-3-like isoform X4 [Narcine bancroftii]|uniref:tectonic-3-like isoform X4 n=1 Tax=Narcine bancroftii TaxID=1343680 RepID=UPI0038318E44